MRVLAAALASIVLGASVGAAPAPPRSPEAPSAGRAHLLVVIDLSQPEARVLSARVVKRDLPRQRGPERGWELRVEDASGRVLHRARIPAGGMLRGERVVGERIEAIAAPDSARRGRGACAAPRGRRRHPDPGAGSRSSRRDRAVARCHLRQRGERRAADRDRTRGVPTGGAVIRAALAILALLGGAVASGAEVEPIVEHGVDNRIGLVILGDGYRAEEQEQMSADARRLTQSLFAASPFAEHEALFTVRLVHLVSNVSGAGYVAPLDTALRSYSGCAGNGILLCTDTGEALRVAAEAFPEFDHAIVMVNVSFRAGSGGASPWSAPTPPRARRSSTSSGTPSAASRTSTTLRTPLLGVLPGGRLPRAERDAADRASRHQVAGLDPARRSAPDARIRRVRRRRRPVRGRALPHDGD